MLGNILPISVYKMQYPFSHGIVVDAVIHVKDKIIPIDAKFSLEGYNRIAECQDPQLIKSFEKAFLNDVKKRIDEVSKYILPEENTTNVAFMFVPADGVYNEIIKLGHTTDIVAYAYSRNVIMVSPTSFFAYLQTVLQALNMMKVEAQVQDIVTYLHESTRYLKQFEENMNKLGKNLGTVINTYNSTNTEARKLSTRISRITNNKEDMILIDPLENTILNERI
jgi:DNA recombination protein RmuC